MPLNVAAGKVGNGRDVRGQSGDQTSISPPARLIFRYVGATGEGTGKQPVNHVRQRVANPVRGTDCLERGLPCSYQPARSLQSRCYSAAHC